MNTETELAPIPAPPAELACMSAAERINLHYRLANDNWKAALEHALLCGWELACQKNRVGWGGWRKWVKENLDFSKDTADRLIGFYEAKIGAERKRIGLALENDISPKEFESACGGTEVKSVTAAMIESGVLKSHSDNWGGDRPGAGRPSKAATATADLELHRKETLHELGEHLAVLGRATGPGGGCVLLSLADLQTLKKELSELLGRVEEMIQSKLPESR